MSDPTALASSLETAIEQIERRSFVRHVTELETVCRLSAHSQSGGLWPVQVCNVSAGGVNLLLGRRFEPGSLLVLELPAGNDGDRSTQLARVVWVAADEWGCWRLGCVFLRELDQDVFKSVLKFPHAA